MTMKYSYKILILFGTRGKHGNNNINQIRKSIFIKYARY